MNVLLIADTGGFPKGYKDTASRKSFFHVGDEAMFINTLRWYRERHPKMRLTGLSWGRKYPGFDASIKPHFVWPTKKYVNRAYLPMILTKVILDKYLNVNIFTSEEKTFVQTLKKQDVFHFTGGGNISSMYPSWLSYMFFLILFGYIHKKKVILMSQTIGPFKMFDSLLARYILRFPSIVGLREPVTLSETFLPHFRNHVHMLDAAYGFKIQGKFNLPKKARRLRIGISLHEWNKDNTDHHTESLSQVISWLDEKYSCEFLLIPHVLYADSKGDGEIMQRMILNVKNKVKKVVTPYRSLPKLNEEKIEYIKYMTETCDINITSRYHGLIFSLSSNVPTLAISFDEYYSQKNLGALSHLYGKKAGIYNINKDGSMYIQMKKKLDIIIAHLDTEKSKLAAFNIKMYKNSNLFTLDRLKSIID